MCVVLTTRNSITVAGGSFTATVPVRSAIAIHTGVQGTGSGTGTGTSGSVNLSPVRLTLKQAVEAEVEEAPELLL